MIALAWNQFERNTAGKDISFESLCYQIAYSLYRNNGQFENYFNTPGSEFYLNVHTNIPDLAAQVGDLIGWQAKWWFDSEDNSSLASSKRDELIENFKTTLRHKPGISHWIVCTPGKFDETAFTKLIDALQALKTGLNIIHWNKETFNSFRSAHFDLLEPIFHHYFNTAFIGFEQIEAFSRSRIQFLHGKFDSDLYAVSENDDQLMALIDMQSAISRIQTDSRALIDVVNRIVRFKTVNPPDFPEYTPEHLAACVKLLDLTIQAGKDIYAIASAATDLDTCRRLRDQIETFRKEYRVIGDALNAEMKDGNHRVDGKKVENETWRYVDLLVDPINDIFGEIFGKPAKWEGEEDEDGLYDALLQIFQHDAHVVSSAGYGKTNIVCNLCNTLLDKKWPAILMLGSAFRGQGLPQNMVVELLTWKNNYSFKEFAQALENLGFVKGIKIPIIIDGLNESTPYHPIWNMHIKDMIAEVSKHDHVILITTCRDMYIQSIFDLQDGREPPNMIQLTGLKKRSLDNAIKNYFRKYNIQPLTWHFDKALFQNPLLLKIFSEVNENNIGVAISLTNLYKSIDRYIEKIENKASEISSRVDAIIKNRIRAGIQSFCKTLWEKGTREITLSEFHALIDPNAPSLTDSLTEKLLDEGLCFQKNLAGTEETVQFTYDAVAGYCIAARYLMPLLDVKDGKITNQILSAELDKKIYSGTVDHALRQDILIAQIHLFPEKFDIQLFEIADKTQVLEEMCNNIEYVIGKEETQQKLYNRMKKEGSKSKLFRLLLEKLFHAIYKKEVHGLGKFTLAVLVDLSQVDIDLLWTELFRKSRDTIEEVLFIMNRDYRWNKLDRQSPKEDKYVAALATTSIDKLVRSRATENLYLIACKQPQEILDLLIEAASFNDVNLVESCVAAICGVVLNKKKPELTATVLKTIAKGFVKKIKHTHINVIDYIETIQEFANEFHGLTRLPKIVFNASRFSLSLDEKILNRRDGRTLSDYLDDFDLDFYDFKKYQISGISNNGYKRYSSYSERQCLAAILHNFKTKGFNKKVGNHMKEIFVEPKERSFPRVLQGSAHEYQEKYLWQSYYEFVGFLRLSNAIKTDEEIPRYRSIYVVFDPTFPKLPSRFQLITNNFLPRIADEVQEWIKKENKDYITDFYCHSLYTDQQWVLLAANMTQIDEATDTRWQLYIDSFFITESKIEKFIPSIRTNRFHYNQHGISFVFAGEIGWSPFANKKESSYWLSPYNMEATVQEHSWSSWSNERDQVPNFKFLIPRFANMLDLTFSVDDLAFVDTDGNAATRIVWAEKQRMFYIRKDVLDKLTKSKRKKLIWYEAVSKYGNWKHSDGAKLRPSRQDTDTIRQYPDKVNNIFQRFSH